MADMSKLKEEDWIALRLLYVLTASDPSTVLLPDVSKALDYYNAKLRPKGDNKYSGGHILPVFALLNKEIAYDKATFSNPEVALTRNLAVNVYYDHGAYDDAGQWYKAPDEIRKELERRNG